MFLLLVDLRFLITCRMLTCFDCLCLGYPLWFLFAWLLFFIVGYYGFADFLCVCLQLVFGFAYVVGAAWLFEFCLFTLVDWFYGWLPWLICFAVCVLLFLMVCFAWCLLFIGVGDWLVILVLTLIWCAFDFLLLVGCYFGKFLRCFFVGCFRCWLLRLLVGFVVYVCLFFAYLFICVWDFRLGWLTCGFCLFGIYGLMFILLWLFELCIVCVEIVCCFTFVVGLIVGLFYLVVDWVRIVDLIILMLFCCLWFVGLFYCCLIVLRVSLRLIVFVLFVLDFVLLLHFYWWYFDWCLIVWLLGFEVFCLFLTCLG